MKEIQIQKQIELQEEALICHEKFGFRSTIHLSVGSGKSKVAITRFEEHYKKNKKFKGLFFGCRELYLENFKLELKKFKKTFLIKNITFVCTQSLKNLKDKFDIIVGDESHKHVESYLGFLNEQTKLNSKVELLCLTGTPILTGDNFIELEKIVPISISKNIDNSVDEGLINDYKVVVYLHKLDSKKNIHIKTKNHNFYTSEEKSYRNIYLKYINSEKTQVFSKEMQYLKLFFKNLNSKIKIVEDIIKSIHNKSSNDKILIYAGSIEQTAKFKYPSYHSKLSKIVKEKNYNTFLKTGKIMTNVDGIKEAVSIPNLKHLIIMHGGASSTSLEQVLGRSLRLIPKKEIGTVHLLVADGTIEKDWCLKSTIKLDKEKIEYVQVN